MIDFRGIPLPANILIFILAAAVVWFAGTRLAHIVDGIAERTGIGRVFAGFLLLGSVTSLPEVAATVTAAASNHPELALGSILGSVAMNVLLLAAADILIGRNALTSVVAHPATLLQGTLGVLLLSVIAFAISYGEVELFGLGVWSAAIIPLFGLAVVLTSRYENRPTWVVADDSHIPGLLPPEDCDVAHGLRGLLLRGVLAGAAILVAGYLLADTGDAIAFETGIGANMIGFILVGVSTSLPEISSMVGAVRLRRYELAIGDIFGTNLFNLLLIPLADIFYRHGPILSVGGTFETIAVLLGIILTSIYVVGLLDRRNRTVLRLGYDSVCVVIVYFGGLILLESVS